MKWLAWQAGWRISYIATTLSLPSHSRLLYLGDDYGFRENDTKLRDNKTALTTNLLGFQLSTCAYLCAILVGLLSMICACGCLSQPVL